MGISFSLSSFWELLVSRWPELVTELFRHINMTTLALLISLAIGVPLGILITRNQTAAKIVIGIANVMQSIPSIALLSLAVCFLGIGTVPAILMVFVYAFLPILKNTYTGIMSVDPKNLEVARGMGLTRTRCLFLVELPIAAPFIMAGIRIAAVASVGTMTIAAFAGAKGLGWFINLGLNSLNVEMILLGAVPVSLLALLFDCHLRQAGAGGHQRGPASQRADSEPAQEGHPPPAGDRRGRVCRPGGGRHRGRPV